MMRQLQALAAACTTATALLAGCAAYGPTPVRSGQSEAELVAAMGPPTGRHVGPGGVPRLEFARGPGGRHTWMVDLDAQGRVAAVQQVLTESQFTQVKDGLSRAEVLALIGRPVHTAGMIRGGQIWSWRWANNDCLWFQVAFNAQGRAQGDGSYGPDPACEVNDRGVR